MIRPLLKPRPLAEERKERREAHAREVAEIRMAVFDRARGRCECCGRRSSALELDHRWGGSGRRREAQSVATCWALMPEHHADKSANKPSAEAWDEKWRAHCARHGYFPGAPAILKAPTRRTA